MFFFLLLFGRGSKSINAVYYGHYLSMKCGFRLMEVFYHVSFYLLTNLFFIAYCKHSRNFHIYKKLFTQSDIKEDYAKYIDYVVKS